MTALAIRRPQLIIINYNHLRHVMTPVGVEPAYDKYSNNYNNTNITMIIINPINMTKVILTIISIKTCCPGAHCPRTCKQDVHGLVSCITSKEKSQWHVIKLTQTQ